MQTSVEHIIVIRDNSLPDRPVYWYADLGTRFVRGERLTLALNQEDIDWLTYLGYPVEEMPATALAEEAWDAN